MSTLSNVISKGCGNASTSVRLTPNTIPQVVDSKTGVSVEYAYNPDGKWFVLRTSYGRAIKACNYLISQGIYAYSALQYKVVIENGRRKKVLKPLVPNLVFAYMTIEQANIYVKYTPALSYLSFYYNHFSTNNDGKNPPLTIPNKEMENFIMATYTRNEHMRMIDEKSCHFKGGEMVRVIDGPFIGVIGKVARIAGQQRVVVSLSPIGMVCTAYIPTAFLEKIEK